MVGAYSFYCYFYDFDLTSLAAWLQLFWFWVCAGRMALLLLCQNAARFSLPSASYSVV